MMIALVVAVSATTTEETKSWSWSRSRPAQGLPLTDPNAVERNPHRHGAHGAGGNVNSPTSWLARMPRPPAIRPPTPPPDFGPGVFPHTPEGHVNPDNYVMWGVKDDPKHSAPPPKPPKRSWIPPAKPPRPSLGYMKFPPAKDQEDNQPTRGDEMV
jgi:hypothetical protein